MVAILADRDFLAQLKAAVATDTAREVDGMLKGMPPDRYREAIGYVRGLTKALELADNIRKQNEREEEKG